jgi:hypothetical protein
MREAEAPCFREEYLGVPVATAFHHASPGIGRHLVLQRVLPPSAGTTGGPRTREGGVEASGASLVPFLVPAALRGTDRAGGPGMHDFLLVLVVFAFFAVAAAYVRGCDRL